MRPWWFKDDNTKIDIWPFYRWLLMGLVFFNLICIMWIWFAKKTFKSAEVNVKSQNEAAVKEPDDIVPPPPSLPPRGGDG